MPTDLEAKYAERDALLSWLSALEREGASLEAATLVRAQLERVLNDIERLGEGLAIGFGLPSKPFGAEALQCPEKVNHERR